MQTVTGISIKPRGRLQQIRGLNIDGVRPDKIILDDIDDDESVKSPERRAETLDWVLSKVLPAQNEVGTVTDEIFFIGTVLHGEAALMKMRYDPQATCIQFGAIDKDGESVWPDMMPLAKLEQIKERYAVQRKLDIFYREYMSEIRPSEGALFQPSFFIMRPELRGELEIRALSIDPAISDKKGADKCAFGVVGVTEKGILLVLECFGKVGMTPREQVDQYFALRKEYQTEKNGIEAVAYQKALVHLIREEMFRKHDYFEIEELRYGRTGKHERITGILQPRYANGYIAHAKRFPGLEGELLDFPNGKDDEADVIAQCVSLLDPYAAFAADPEKDLAADEYEPHGNWRNY